TVPAPPDLMAKPASPRGTPMAAPTTADAFLGLVRRSGAVDAAALDAYLGRPGASPVPADGPGPLAAALVRGALLTPLHARHLLRGKWRGFLLGKYRLLQLIGAGGMGRVFLGEHTVMRRPVAIKMLPANLTADPSAVPRLHREARAAAALD